MFGWFKNKINVPNVLPFIVDTPPMPSVVAPMEDKTMPSMGRRISSILEPLCPSFEREPGGGSIEWHRCKCHAAGGACTCVWHVTDTCVAGTWTQLAFAKKHNEKEQESRAKSLGAAQQAVLKVEDEPIEDRFHILDLDNDV